MAGRPFFPQELSLILTLYFLGKGGRDRPFFPGNCLSFYLCSRGSVSRPTSVPRKVTLFLSLFSGLPFLLPLFLKACLSSCMFPVTFLSSWLCSLLVCLSTMSSQKAILFSDPCFLWCVSPHPLFPRSVSLSIPLLPSDGLTSSTVSK